ncbi:MAG: M23 family metallopeptidase [Dehalococcoidia bacterium]|nr:M23 family metallopeptidase [Dehalococcoidia bacterium]
MIHLVRLILVALPIAVALFVVVEHYPEPRDAMQRGASWLSDETAPEVEADLPPGYVRGLMPVRIALKDESGAKIKSLTVDGNPFPAAETFEIDTAHLPDGGHTLMIEAVDLSRQENSSQRSFSFRTDNTPPKVTVQIDPPKVGQGHTVSIRISSSEPVTLTGTLEGQSLTLSPLDGRFWTVAGFDADSRVGPRSLNLAAVDKVGLQITVQIPITVTRVDYPTESLEIPEDRSDLLDPAVANAEIAFLDKVYAALTAEKLWSGSFAIPALAETSSPFAISRSYNGGPMGGHHGGMDIAANEGVPVAASNRGRVAVAEPLKVRGNVVILDHGMGVYSAYFHLSQIRVQKDQMIEKGQIVGLVGNTGLSTGAHLHWEMRVTGAAVDPLEWTARTIP